MSDTKFCVFCGRPPESKSREHVLPQWLLRLTGDPNRTVSMGYSYKGKREISFSWSSLVTPACESCNNEYASLESEVRPILEAILERQSLPVSKYCVLLDWLDKVRVGLWLNYHHLMGNPTEIKPSFFVGSRMRKKDRFVSIYPMKGSAKGLNAYGVETLSFHAAPTAFGLRVNNLFIVNCSSDYIFSGRCGLPYPTSMHFQLDGENHGCLQLGEFKATQKIKSPLFGFKLHKPAISLFQPIMQNAITDSDHESLPLGVGLMDKAYLLESTIQGDQLGVGKIYRQFKDCVVRLDDGETLIEFDDIKGSECRAAGRLIAQVYELQTFLQALYTPLTCSLEVRNSWDQRQKLLKKLNKDASSSYIRASSQR
ncbi:hypothetical protein SB757_13550 [Pseudomonas sp. SIMBA_065]